MVITRFPERIAGATFKLDMSRHDVCSKAYYDLLDTEYDYDIDLGEHLVEILKEGFEGFGEAVGSLGIDDTEEGREWLASLKDKDDWWGELALKLLKENDGDTLYGTLEDIFGGDEIILKYYQDEAEEHAIEEWYVDNYYGDTSVDDDYD